MAVLDFSSFGAGASSASTDTVDVLVKVGGKELSHETAACVLDMNISQSVGVAAQLTLRVTAWDSESETLSWTDDKMFEPGSSVEIELGYVDHREVVFSGEIVGLDFSASPTERAVLTINAYDILHRLHRGQRRDQYTKKNYAAIARDIAQRRNLQTDIEDDRNADPEHDNVTQKNKSDLDFLKELAAEIGYEVLAKGKKLVFRKARAASQAELTLDARELLQFSAQLAASEQIGGVDVIAFDSKSKKSIKVSEDNNDSADKTYGDARVMLIQDPYTSDAQGKSRAKAELQRIRENYISATATCFGRTDLRPNMTVKIDKLSKRFDGNYYVSQVTHTVSATGGYRTRLTLKGQPR